MDGKILNFLCMIIFSPVADMQCFLKVDTITGKIVFVGGGGIGGFGVLK